MNLPTRKSLRKAKTSSIRDSEERVLKTNSSLTSEELNPSLNYTSSPFVLDGLKKNLQKKSEISYTDGKKLEEKLTRITKSNLTSLPGDDNGAWDSSYQNVKENHHLSKLIFTSLFNNFTLLAASNLNQDKNNTFVNGRSSLLSITNDSDTLINTHLESKNSDSAVGRERVERLQTPIHFSQVQPTKPVKMVKEDKAVEVILKSLLSGGIAGMCAKTAVAPLDRMKILLQAHSRHYSHLGVFSGLKGIVEKERFFALYKGNGAQMVRIFPYAATQFTSFEMYKKLFGEHSHIGRFAAGSAAGVTAVALTYPLDTIRARLAFQVSGEHLYNGIYQCATHIFREEGGIRALYRGFIPTLCGMVPYAGLSFYCFESFKYLCMKYFPGLTCKRHTTNTGGLVLMLPYKLLCGGVAGAAAQTVSYPLDVTRRRMQLAMMNENTKKFGMGMVQTLKMIYQENGISRGLYRGMSINYLRAIPMVAVSFTTYELVKQMLSLDTGLQIKTG